MLLEYERFLHSMNMEIYFPLLILEVPLLFVSNEILCGMVITLFRIRGCFIYIFISFEFFDRSSERK